MNRIDLDSIRIASPCSAKWEDMVGDDRKRHCLECRLDVHDLSAMPRAEADAWLAARRGRACLRLRKRADGRLITNDCPVGLRARARRSLKVVTGAGIVVIGGALAFLSSLGSRDHDPFSEMPLPAEWTPIPTRTSLLDRLEARCDRAADWLAHRTGWLRFCNCRSTIMGMSVPEVVRIEIERIEPPPGSAGK